MYNYRNACLIGLACLRLIEPKKEINIKIIEK